MADTEQDRVWALTVTPESAEYWDSPASAISYVKMAAAAVSGSRPDLGGNRKAGMR